MAKITRYSGDLKPFASNSTGLKRTVFGDTTQANDIDSNITTDFLLGWESIGDETNNFPTIQDFNALGYTHGQILAYLHQAGVPEWSGTQEYHTGSIVNVSGTLYTCKTDSHVSATSPAADGVNWSVMTQFISDNISSLRGIAPSSGQIVFLKAHTTAGDGGHGYFRGITGAAAGTYVDDDGLTTVVPTGGDGSAAHLRINIGAAYPEFAGGDTAAINAAFAAQSVKLDNKNYVVDAELVATENLHKMTGEGWHRDFAGVWYGSKISAASSAVANLLKISGGALSRGLHLSDFSLFPLGAGKALHIENLIYGVIRNIRILGNNTPGSTGVHLDSAFFGVLDQVVISGFTGPSVLISGSGSQNTIINCTIAASTASDAIAAVEIQSPGTIVRGGQIDSARTGGNGIGIFFNNIDASAKGGGLVDGTLSEYDTAVYVGGATHPFTDITVRDIKVSLGSGQTGCHFQRANNCQMINPVVVSPTGGTVVNFGLNAVNCVLIGNYNACRAGIVVSVSAVNSMATCTTKITLAERANLSVQANLTFIADDVVNLGRCVHNGTAWDKDEASLADDTATSFVVPRNRGIVSVSDGFSLGEHVKCYYDAVAGTLEAFDTGSKFQVNATDGTLAGTTGTDGFFTIRASSTGAIYVENRRGTLRTPIIKFDIYV